MPSIIALNIDENDFAEENRNFILKTTELPDVYLLFAKDSAGKLVKIGLASVTNMNVSQYLIKTIQENGDDKPLLVRCRYVPRFKKWEPICLAPNGEKISILN